MGGGISVDKTIILKGFATIGVYCAHVGSFLGIRINTKIDVAVGMLGYLFVGVFFFLSGYGVQTQYKKKGIEYIHKLPQKVVALYIVEVICIFIYLLFDVLIQQRVEPDVLIKSFLFGDTIVSNGWYLQVALLMYLIYYLSAVLLNDSIKSEYLLTIFLTIYILLCIRFSLISIWYQSVPLFLIGVLCSEHLEVFIRFINKKGIGIISLILFVIIVSLRSVDTLSFGSVLSLTVISEILWTIMIIKFVIILTSLQITRILKFLGKHSLEIYIFQGLTFRFSRMISNNSFISLGISIAFVLGISILTHPLFTHIKKAFQN